VEDFSLSGQPINPSHEVLHGCSRVGLFDSGVGGLSVLRQLQTFATSAGQDINFVYFGDTARCPYGNRTAAEISVYVREIIAWLNRQEVDAIVMACNTSAALAYESARASTTVPVLDLISPTASYAVQSATKIGVMATASTVRSKAFSRAIQSLKPSLEVIEVGCPELVPIIESGRFDEPATSVILSRYIRQFQDQGIDALILGCTHFPFLRDAIQRLSGDKIALIDPAEVLTNGGKGVLQRFVSETAQVDVGRVDDVSFNTEFFVTGDPESFAVSAAKCLGQPISTVNKVPLEHLTKILTADVSEETLIAAQRISQTSLSSRG
jgi:glutamate racemase